MAIRFEVFVDEQHVPAEEEPDHYDADALHFIALHAQTGTPAGTARLVEKPGGMAKIGRVAVRQAYRGLGVGKILMQAVLDAARARGLAHAVLDAQVPVIGFYETLGFVAEGPVFDDAGIPHRTMRRAV